MKISIINRLTKITPYIISAASLIFAAQFLFHTLDSSLITYNVFWVILTLSVILLVFIGLRNEMKTIKETKLERADFQIPDLAKSFLVIVSSALITYFFTEIFNTTTIFSASLICVIYTYVFPNNQPEAYSGTVAGMIGAYLCGDWVVVLTTAVTTGLVFILFKPYFKGVGGRGGSIPYVATTLVVRLIFQLKPRQQVPIEPEYIIPAFFTIILVAFLTYILQEKEILTIVRSAMILAFIFSIIIPNEYYTITIAMFAGTVIGMSASERIENYLHLFLIILFCFVLFIPSFHILDGIGGKLGILCFVSYYASQGFKIIIQSFVKKDNRKLIDV